jgi:tetratricopeptide (TPR) repeat protein
MPTADKHYQLANIYFKIGSKEEALKEYLKTKQTLEMHKQHSTPEYGTVLLKLALLFLSFGKVSDCVGSSLEALKIFNANEQHEEEEI